MEFEWTITINKKMEIVTDFVPYLGIAVAHSS